MLLVKTLVQDFRKFSRWRLWACMQACKPAGYSIVSSAVLLFVRMRSIFVLWLIMSSCILYVELWWKADASCQMTRELLL
jgi:hypothetical protein